MEKFRNFARLTKFDVNTGYFEAVLADESLDRSGEIMDYEKSAPNFKKWSADIAALTNGQSAGNLRAMHGKTVAGKFTKVDCDDTARAVKVAGLVVDANEKEKFSKGCYTGLSIGGDYGAKWPDPVVKGAIRYEALPVEGSLVDYPCNANATFTVIKADGSSELAKFENSMDNPAAMKKWWDGLEPDEQAVMQKLAASAGIIQPAPPAAPAPEAPAPDPVAVKKALDEQRAAAKKTLFEKVAAAIMAKGAPAERVALALGKATGLDTKLEKGLWTVSWLVELLGGLDCLADDVEWEAMVEADGSALPAELMAVVKQLGQILVRMVQEEVSELTGETSALKAWATGTLQKGERVITREALAKLQEGAAQVEPLTKKAAELEGQVTELTKAVGVRDDLMVKASARIDEQRGLIEKLNMAPAPVRAGLTSIEKGKDLGDSGQPAIEEVKNPDGTVNKVATALKECLAMPVVVR